MLTLYLVCLMFGGTLLALSFLGGSDHDSDHGDMGDGDADIDAEIGSADIHAEIGSGDVDIHADVDIGSDVDVSTEIDVSGEVDMSTDIGDSDVGETSVELHGGPHGLQHGPVDSSAVQQVEGQAVGDAFKFISLRSLIFFTAFFGLTGSVLTWLEIASLVTLGSAIGLGGFAAVLTHRLMNYFQRTESGEAVDVYTLRGHTAKVVLSPTKTVKGKVKLTAQGQTLTLLALLDESSELEMLPLNSWALVVRVEKQAVYVIQADYIE